MSYQPFNPNDIFLSLEQAAEERAEAEYTAHRLERLGEILIADLIVKAKHEGNPVGICKEIARATDEWKQHIEGEAVAKQNLSRARAKYENLKILAELRRTQESSARALTRSGGV